MSKDIERQITDLRQRAIKLGRRDPGHEPLASAGPTDAKVDGEFLQVRIEGRAAFRCFASSLVCDKDLVF